MSCSPIDIQPVRRALLSVSDKRGIVELAQFLVRHNVEILSTGGTAKVLREANVKVIDVSDYTGFPEMMAGRVKTLHPKIHGGLLAIRDDVQHRNAMEDHDIGAIDLLVLNLYPFEETIAKGADASEVVENIDIGGPSMLRSAAKNHAYVTVVINPDDYEVVMEKITSDNGTDLALRRQLAAKAFNRSAAYDAAISNWFYQQENMVFDTPYLVQTARLKQPLRYGENPHQRAAFYVHNDTAYGIATATQHQGKELSYNNINDTDAAFALVSEFAQPSVAIIKHANPSGFASGMNLSLAYEKALACDPVSAFGGIIAVNKTIDVSLVETMGKLFTEVIIGPDIQKAAAKKLSVKKNLRVLTTGGMADSAGPLLTMKMVNNGLLVQDQDNKQIGQGDITVVTKRQPTEEEIADLLFAFKVCKHVKSNAIVFARNQATIGIGAGQMSRIDSVRIAQQKAKEANLSTEDSVMASDAFFPFDDNIHAAAKAGVRAIIQPGGSKRDAEVIAAADSYDMAMVFTGIRHFRH